MNTFRLSKMLDDKIAIRFVKTLIYSCLVSFICSCGSLTVDRVDGPSLFIKATGYGATRNLALQDSFKNAIQQAYGTFVISSARLENNVLTKDVTNEYSTGIIKNFEVLSEGKGKLGSYQVSIGALVSSSKLFNYVLSLNKTHSPSNADGAQIYAHISTAFSSKVQGDNLLNSLMNQYPSPAIKVQLGTMTTKIDSNRQAFLVLPYQIQWNNEFLESFKQVVEYVSVKKCSVIPGVNNQCEYHIGFSNGFWEFGTQTGYTLTDNVQFYLLANRLNHMVGLKVEFYNIDGVSLGGTCADVNLASNWGQSITASGNVIPVLKPLVYSDGSKIIINDKTINGSTMIPVKSGEPFIHVKKIRGSLTQSCRNFLLRSLDL